MELKVYVNQYTSGQNLYPILILITIKYVFHLCFLHELLMHSQHIFKRLIQYTVLTVEQQLSTIRTKICVVREMLPTMATRFHYFEQ